MDKAKLQAIANLAKLRPDILGNSMTRDEISKIAPKFENGYIVVPRVIET